MKRTTILWALLAMLLAVPVIAAVVTNPGGSGGGGGSASAAGSTSAVQTNTGGLLADSGCEAVQGSAKMTCLNGFVASVATLTNLSMTQATMSLITASSATFTNLSVTNRTGTGAPVFGSSPTLTTPNLGTPSQVFLVNGASMPATGLTGTVPVGNGGTGSTSFTGSRCIESNAGGTALVVAAGACGTGGGGAASAVGASGAIQAANNSSAMADSGCYVSISGQMTCPGGFVAGTSALGVMTLLEGTATGAGAATGEHNCWIDSTDSLLHCFENGAASAATYVTTQVPATFWNKTYNTEATGNLLTVVREYRFPMAGAIGTTAGSVWNLPTSNPAVASAIQGTNVIQGVLNFPAAADTSAQVEHWISRFWDGGQVDAELTWMATPTTGTMVMYLQSVCIADPETNDPSFNATGANNTFTDVVKGTTLQTNLATIASLTMTGCAPGERLILKLRRASAPTDTMAGAPVSALNLKLWFREILRKVAL